MNELKAIAVGMLASVVVASCASAAQQERPAAVAAAARDGSSVKRLSCANALGPVRDPVRRFDAVAGPVRFVSARRVSRHPRRHFAPTRAPDFTLKSPLVVERGADVQIVVARADRGHVSLTYATKGGQPDRVKSGVDVLDIRACDDGPATGWQGAIVVDGARCVRLLVTHDVTTTTLRIPLGKGTCRRITDAAPAGVR